jgi:hypothetical protein
MTRVELTVSRNKIEASPLFYPGLLDDPEHRLVRPVGVAKGGDDEWQGPPNKHGLDWWLTAPQLATAHL